MKRYFMAAAVPAEAPLALCQVMNWADRNNFKVFQILTILMPQLSKIAGPQGNIIKPVNMVYIESGPKEFKKYFGFEYNETRLHELPEIIAKKQDGDDLQIFKS